MVVERADWDGLTKDCLSSVYDGGRDGGGGGGGSNGDGRQAC